MGTLFNQPERENRKITIEDIDNFLSDAHEIAKKYKIEIKDVIAAKSALEIARRNDLYVLNGNVFAEQLTGFGDILKDIHITLNEIVEK